MGAEIESRDLDKQRLTEAELEELIGNRDYKEFLNARNELYCARADIPSFSACDRAHFRDYKEFLNARNELYRTRKMKEYPPSRPEAIQLMAKEPNLIRRPVVIRDSQIVLGLDEKAYRKLMK